MTREMSFEDLNDDCFLYIIYQLNITEKVRCQRISKRWKQLVDIDLRRQKVISSLLKEPARWSNCCLCYPTTQNTLAPAIKLTDLVRLLGKCPNLVGLNLHNVIVTEKDLESLSRLEFWWKSLKHLEICYSNLHLINKDQLTVALKRCLNLRHLSLYKSNDLWSMEVIHSCPKLEHLVLGFHTINDHLNLKSLNPGLSKLEIHGLGLSYQELIGLTSGPNARNLLHLKLRNSLFSVNALSLICQSLVNLKSLEIPLPYSSANTPFYCQKIGQLIASLQGLEKLSIMHRTLYEDMNIDEVMVSIVNEIGHNLKSIKVGLYPVSDVTLVAIGENCPRLEELHVVFNEVYRFHKSLESDKFFSTKVTNICVPALTNLKRLRTLNLSLSAIDDNAVKAIVAGCSKVNHLEVNSCKGVTRKSLVEFMKAAAEKPKLDFFFSAENTKLALLRKDLKQVRELQNFSAKLPDRMMARRSKRHASGASEFKAVS